MSIDGEQSSPSHAQAKRLRELDQAGKLNGDVIDGILSEKKKEDRGVIISMAELEKYFGKEVTPVKMKEQIMSLAGRMERETAARAEKPEKKADLRSNLETLCPEVFSRPFTEGSGGLSPVAAQIKAQSGAACQGGMAPPSQAACLDGRPWLCYSSGATGYILQSAAPSHDWERAGGLG